jgi:ribokinase
MAAPILVLGSSNTDLVIKTDRFPMPGETIIGGDFHLFPGGKGANQAVAAARLGASVRFITKLGQDLFGDQALEGFLREGILCDYILRDPVNPSGTAMIVVNANGQNQIVVAPGSNARIKREEINQLQSAFDGVEYFLLQLETNLEAVYHAIDLAYRHGIKIILNPAPATALDPSIYPKLFLISPNETEASLLTGISVQNLTTAAQAADWFLDQGLEQVIITLGEQGAFFKSRTEQKHILPARVKAMDTTAAGDVFNGALVVALAEGFGWQTAMEFACTAAAISVTRMGAQASAPGRSEVDSFSQFSID